MFDKGKTHVQKNGANSKINALTCMAVPIDKRVVSQIHHFKEIDRATVQPMRNVDFTKDTFSLVLRLDRLEKPLRDLGIHKVVNNVNADWFSPNAGNVPLPYGDLEVARHCKHVAKDLHLMEFRSFAELALVNMCLRAKGTDDWYWCEGSIVGELVSAWPMKLVRGDA